VPHDQTISSRRFSAPPALCGGPPGGVSVRIGNVTGPETTFTSPPCAGPAGGTPDRTTQSGPNDGGGGITIGPAPRQPVTPPCKILDPFFNSLELSVLVGVEAEAGASKLGLTRYKNVMTGEQGTQFAANLPLGGIQVTNPTPNTGNLTTYAHGLQVVVNFFGFETNIANNNPPEFKPFRDFGIGGALGVGLELSFNAKKFEEISKANEACRAQGGS
jgi:hypothetical protein